MFTIYGRGCHLGHVTRTIWTKFRSRVLIPLFHTVHESPESPQIDFTHWFGRIREVSLKDFLPSWWSTSQSRFRYDFVTNIRGNRLNSAGIAQEFITISKITLYHAARKLRNQLVSDKNMPNAARIGHELKEIRDESPRFARFSLTIVIKNAHLCFGGHQFQNECSS